MSNSAFDIFLDHEIDEHFEEDVPPDPYWSEESNWVEDLYWSDEPAIEPNNDYDNYDGWDDMQ
jgi:hypothetical protein